MPRRERSRGTCVKNGVYHSPFSSLKWEICTFVPVCFLPSDPPQRVTRRILRERAALFGTVLGPTRTTSQKCRAVPRRARIGSKTCVSLNSMLDSNKDEEIECE
jgi:hypothetical protein